jgi:hypothetical protein
MHVPLQNIPSATLDDLRPTVLAMMALLALQLSIKQNREHLFCKFHLRPLQVVNHLSVDVTKLGSA